MKHQLHPRPYIPLQRKGAGPDGAYLTPPGYNGMSLTQRQLAEEAMVSHVPGVEEEMVDPTELEQDLLEGDMEHEGTMASELPHDSPQSDEPLQAKFRGALPIQRQARLTGVIQRVKTPTTKKYYHDKHFKFSLKKEKNKFGKKIKHNVLFNQHVSALIDGLDDDRYHLSGVEKKMLKKKLATKTLRNLRKKSNKFKRNITEKVGELNATQVMNKNFPNAKLLHGYVKGVGFDQVWDDGGTIIVVEAKGPGATLGVSDRKGAQMSLNWVKLTAQGMKSSAPKVSKIVLNAIKNGNIRRLVITSTKGGNAPQNFDEL